MQTLLPLEQTGYVNNDSLAGFRLQRFEVLNWGTFDQRPWVLDLQGNIALLTGANASGKSTLVDGLLTLLVPNRQRNYNLASSGTGKKERDEKSYVQGAYRRTLAEESNSSKPKVLRDKGKLTVLLAYFCDRLLKQDITLAQVLWIEDGSVRKFFVVAEQELSIADHFLTSTQISDLKKRLKASGVELFDQFKEYSQKFCKRFGLQSEKALDLFNQTVSIKEIGGLNEFVRNHMLEKTDVQTKIRELQESYENLTICHTAIQDARRQLEALLPLTEEAEKYDRLTDEVDTLRQFQSVVPAFFAREKLVLLTQDLQIIEQELNQAQNNYTESEQRLENLRQQEKDLEFSIKQDSIGQRLQELTREIEQRKKEVNNKQNRAKEYDRLAQSLNFSQYNDSTKFYEARTRGENLKQEIDIAIQTLEAQRDEAITQRGEQQKQQTKLKQELESLRRRKSQIPQKNLEIRDRLVHALNLDETDLPFVGELLQVRSEAQEWEGAIERLLGGFGLCILVPEVHYQVVNAYVNRTHLKGRLVYYPVTTTTPNPMQRAFELHRVPSKLEIKQDDNMFSQWLRDRLLRQFNYVCCDTIEQFQHETQAITKNGLLKQNGERHEKDDRYEIGDRSQYILGWNNADKIKALEAELSQVDGKLAQIEQQVQSLKHQSSQQYNKKNLLQDFMRFTDFSEINWRVVELECLRIQEQKQQLEASSEHLKQLEIQLKGTRQDIAQAEQQKVKSIQKIQTLEDRKRENQTEQNQCEIKLQSVNNLNIEAFVKDIETKLKQYTMTLETIAADEMDLRDDLQQQLRQRERQQVNAQSTLEKTMWRFKQDFPEKTSEMGTTYEFLDDYLQLKLQIEQDDLPRHEQKFKELLNEKVIMAISMFKSSLEKQEEDIQDNINELNNSLQQINYTDSTYIKLCYRASQNHAIRDFKQDLIDCLGNIACYSAEDNEKRFQNIQKRLIERFKADSNWTNSVTDVRNWLDFSVSERYHSDHTEKEHHTDSSGKSGGQKVKLAYTILASAIAYQFGLSHNSGTPKSFRLVVIDEAFSKLDDGNAHYAMELFKNLNLQLLVITPKDKINVIESYLSSLHFVANTKEENYSSIASVSIQEYRQKRQIVLNQNHDQSYSNSTKS